jgi:3',5'-cyclic AMP phosphodiesterase CpdA
LRAICGAISQQRDEGTRFDFVLATGDVAYAGKPQDYRLAAGFFEAVGAASGVPKATIFCVPGNHDIDRERQKMCFAGCRHALQSRSQ